MKYNYDKDVLSKYPKYIGIINGCNLTIKGLYAEVTDSSTSPNKPAPLYVELCGNAYKGTVITDFSSVKYGNDVLDLFG